MLSAPSSDEVHQGSKLTSMHTTIARWDHDFERQLTHRLRLPRFVGHIESPVLCVGARLGAEVKAFRARCQVCCLLARITIRATATRT